MSLWTRTSKPHWAPNAVVGKDGWVHPVTNETLVTFDTKGGITFDLYTVTGKFLVGETVTGTGGATGIVASYSVSLSTYTLVLNVVTGTFHTTDTLTGGSSGATATVSALNPNSITVGPGVVTSPSINSVSFTKGFVAASGQPRINTKTKFVTNDYLKFSVQFNSQIKVTGIPYLSLMLTSGAVYVPYVPKTGFDLGENTGYTTGGTATLMFIYRIQSGDNAKLAGASLSSPIQLNGGTVKSYINGNVATVTFSTTSVNSTLAGITVN